MFEKDRLFASLLLMFSVIGFVLVAGNFSVAPVAPVGNSGLITYKGISCVGINEPAEQGECSNNAFTEFGQNLTRQVLATTGAGIITEYIAVGNLTAPTTTSVSLANEYADCGLSRATGTLKNVTGGCTVASCPGNWSIEKEFTATCARAVNTTGLFDTSSGNTMFAGNNFVEASLQSNDRINVTWFVMVT